MSGARWISLGLVVLGAVAFAALLLQRQEAAALRREIGLLREEGRQLASMRAEHERLRTEKISDAELERLRGDRAALVRLRSEIETMRTRAEKMAAAQQEKAPQPPPALVLNVAIAPDGGLSLDGGPIDLNTLRQRLAPFAGTNDHVAFRLRTAADVRKDDVARALSAMLGLAKELRVRSAVTFESSAR